MSDSLVSIVIPVYNGADYLKEAVDSALGQTYQNVEVIVVNDGSTDNGQTETIAKSYGNQIQYFRKENGGVATALNYGIKNMRGRWFAWLSHDDIFSENRIETDMAVITAHPASRITYCKLTYMDANGKKLRSKKYPPFQRVTNPHEAMLLGGVNMCTMTIHKSCFDKTGLFNEKNRTTQDVEMSLRLSREFPYYLNNQAVTFSRDHPNRGTRTLSKHHKEDLLKLSDVIHREFPIQDFFPELNDNEAEIADAWIWLGDLYWGFGARHYAEEAYIFAASSQKNNYRRQLMTWYLRTRKIKGMRRIFLLIRRFFNSAK